MCFTYLSRMLTWSESYMVTCLYFCKCDVLMGEQFTVQLGVWFPHHKSHVTLIYFFEILSTYMCIFFQLWLCKYLVIFSHWYLYFIFQMGSCWRNSAMYLSLILAVFEINPVLFPRSYQDSCQGQLTLLSLFLQKPHAISPFLLLSSFKISMQSIVET